MCSGSEVGSYLRLIDFVYHSTLGVRVIKKKKKIPDGVQEEEGKGEGHRRWGGRGNRLAGPRYTNAHSNNNATGTATQNSHPESMHARGTFSLATPYNLNTPQPTPYTLHPSPYILKPFLRLHPTT